MPAGNEFNLTRPSLQTRPFDATFCLYQVKKTHSFAFVSLQICRFKEQQWISKIYSSRSHLIWFTIRWATVTIFRWLLAANTLLLMITFEQLFKKKTSLKIVSHSVWQTANSSVCLATHLVMPLSRKSEEEEEEECETFLQNNSQPTTLKLLETGCVYICCVKESRAVCCV